MPSARPPFLPWIPPFAFALPYARSKELLTLDEVVRLTPRERLAFISLLWDSLENGQLPMTPAQQGGSVGVRPEGPAQEEPRVKSWESGCPRSSRPVRAERSEETKSAAIQQQAAFLSALTGRNRFIAYLTQGCAALHPGLFSSAPYGSVLAMPAAMEFPHNATISRMKPDLYTKAVLTGILIFLAVIAFKLSGNPSSATRSNQVAPVTAANPIASPIPVAAEGAFAGLQFTGEAGNFSLFDPRTGDIWTYRYASNAPFLMFHSKISAPGGQASAIR